MFNLVEIQNTFLPSKVVYEGSLRSKQGTYLRTKVRMKVDYLISRKYTNEGRSMPKSHPRVSRYPRTCRCLSGLQFIFQTRPVARSRFHKGSCHKAKQTRLRWTMVFRTLLSIQPSARWRGVQSSLPRQNPLEACCSTPRATLACSTVCILATFLRRPTAAASESGKQPSTLDECATCKPNLCFLYL